jgi:hypothetical protein
MFNSTPGLWIPALALLGRNDSDESLKTWMDRTGPLVSVGELRLN